MESAVLISVSNQRTHCTVEKWGDLCRAHIDPTVNKVVPNFDLPASFEERLRIRNGDPAELGNSRHAFIVQALLRVLIERPNSRLSLRPTHLPSISTLLPHYGGLGLTSSDGRLRTPSLSKS